MRSPDAGAVLRGLGRTVWAGTFYLALHVGVAMASVPVDELRDLEPGSALRIDLPYGDVRIKGSDSRSLRVSGEVEAPLRGVRVFRDGGAMEVRPRYAWAERLRRLVGSAPPYEARLLIEVPSDVRLFVVARDCTFEIEDITGPIGVFVVSSDVSVRGEPERLEFETVSGSVWFDGKTRSLQSVTMSGALRVAGQVDRVQAESVTGPVEVSAEGLQSATLRTVSGAVTVSVSDRESSTLDVRTESGPVTLARASEAGDQDLDLETRDSDVVDEAGSLEPVTDERGWRVLRHTAEPGRPRVRVSSRSGLVRLVAQLE